MKQRKKRHTVKFASSLNQFTKESKKLVRKGTPYVTKGISTIYDTMATGVNLGIEQIQKRKTRRRLKKK